MDVSTYIKNSDEWKFIPIENFAGPFDDPHYINGAIVIQHDYKELLGVQEFDLVDQLWCYFTYDIEKLQSGESVKGGFPDQPLDYSFEIMESNRIKVQFDDKIAIVPDKLFMPLPQKLWVKNLILPCC